eukprot:maker-scaffold1165_size57908-snap-gene-0.7 protein:Tk03770 transcript:maker-scaffold1165_size57908-snap-gene-0.7-mRNA-1 annotation:"polyketide synthase type i"
MRNLIGVSFVTLLLVLGSSQAPFIPRMTNGIQPVIEKNLSSGECLSVTSPNHPNKYPNALGGQTYFCQMKIT